MNWYTDLATVNRTEAYQEGSLTKHRRITVAENVPCRVFQDSNARAMMRETAAEVSPRDMLACDNDADIRAGDELLIVRGGALGHDGEPARYFAGEPTPYYEPFGGAVPDLSHQEIPLSGERRI
jgi:hypothetical protein